MTRINELEKLKREKSGWMGACWHRISPWLVSAIVASSVVLLLLMLSFLFPDLWVRLVGDNGSFQGLFPFGDVYSLTRTCLAFILFAGGVYLGLGFGLLKRRFPGPSECRSVSAHIALTLAIAGLFLMIPLLIAIWCLATKNGYMPTGSWGIYEGNHGPWRHLYELRRLLLYVGCTPLCSFVLGGVFYYLNDSISRNIDGG